MTSYYIINQEGIGYVVAELATEENWHLGNRYVCNFGYRQSDAMEFRNDCNDGKIEPRRIKYLMDNYTRQPYKYCGKGILKKQKE